MKKNNNKGIIMLPNYTWLILFVMVSSFLSFFYTKNQKEKDLKKINNEIANIFKGEERVAGYIIGDESIIQGTMHKVIKTENLLGWKSFSAGDNLLYILSENNPDSLSPLEATRYSKVKDLVEYYEIIRGGYYMKPVFELKVATKTDNGYSISTSFSGDMAYKVSDSSFTELKEPYWEVKKINWEGRPWQPPPSVSTQMKWRTKKIWYSNNRPSIFDCYKSSVDYLAFESIDEPTAKGDYSDIALTLPFLKSNYYEIEQTDIQEYHSLGYDTIYVKNNFTNNKFSYRKRSNPITSLTDLDDSIVFNSEYIVWHKSYTNRYIIKPQKWMFIKYFAINLLIGFFISLLIYLFLKYRRKIVILKP